MIDVIIPYYNNRPGLIKCLASLIAQTTNEEFTVTVVDDYSPESVDDIISDFSKFLDLHYIKLDHNHKYPGLVRQIGIDATRNDHIMFMDSDDIFSNEAIQFTYKVIRELGDELEFVQTKFKVVNKVDDRYIITINEAKVLTWLHGCIYSRKFLEKYNIRFKTGYNEDVGFNLTCHMARGKEANLPDVYTYYWLFNENSITRSGSSDYIEEGEENYINTLFTTCFELIDNKLYDQKRVVAQTGISFYSCYDMILRQPHREEEIVGKVKPFIDFIQKSYDLYPDEFIKHFNVFLKENQYLKFNRHFQPNDYFKAVGLKIISGALFL